MSKLENSILAERCDSCDDWFFFENPGIIFLLGGLGAGKTELALNLALTYSEKFGRGKVDLIDLDIVNPFFRVRKVRRDLDAYGINVVIPSSRVAEGDLPALPASVWNALERKDRRIVCDVGGGELGLRPLGRLKEFATQRTSAVFFVINPYRPGFQSIEQMTKSFYHLQSLSALSATHIVANPHLMHQTTVETFLEGLKLVKTFSEIVRIPVAFSMVSKSLIENIKGKIDGNVFLIRRFWEIPWSPGLSTNTHDMTDVTPKKSHKIGPIGF